MKQETKKFFLDIKNKIKEAFTPRKPKRATVIKLLCFIAALCLLALSSPFIISGSIALSQKDRVHAVDETPASADFDYIVVFGAKVKADGTLSDMLSDRVETGVRLYFEGVADKILMSGDSEESDYDEVRAMKNYAVELGVPEEDIVLDGYGLSTYDSVIRAKEVYGAKRLVLVTQEYHLYRALYISDKLGVEALGVSADIRTYRGQIARDVREVLARVKDFYMILIDAEAQYGEKWN